MAANKIDLIAVKQYIAGTPPENRSRRLSIFSYLYINWRRNYPSFGGLLGKYYRKHLLWNLHQRKRQLYMNHRKMSLLLNKIREYFSIKGKRVEKLIAMTDFDNPVSLRRFERAWKFMGLDKLLKKEGIQEGDTVNLYGVEFFFFGQERML